MQKVKKKYILTGIVIFTLLSLYFYYNPSNYNFFPECAFYKITNLYCPGCGSQRAIHDLTHLNLKDAFGHNALMMISIIGLGGIYFYSKKKFNNFLYHPKTPYIVFTIILLFWILRNLNITPFHYLAP